MPTIIVLGGGSFGVFADELPLPAVTAGVATGFRYDGMGSSLQSGQRLDEAAA
jgi:hypothetical protein